MKKIYTCLFIILITILFVKCKCNCSEDIILNENKEVGIDSIYIESDSLFEIADQLINEIYIEQESYDNTIYEQEIMIKDKGKEIEKVQTQIEEKEELIQKEHELYEQEKVKFLESQKLTKWYVNYTDEIRRRYKKERDSLKIVINELKKPFIVKDTIYQTITIVDTVFVTKEVKNKKNERKKNN